MRDGRGRKRRKEGGRWDKERGRGYRERGKEGESKKGREQKG